MVTHETVAARVALGRLRPVTRVRLSNGSRDHPKQSGGRIVSVNRTRLEWTDFTWNPVTGCSHMSRACDGPVHAAAALMRAVGDYRGDRSGHGEYQHDDLERLVRTGWFRWDARDVPLKVTNDPAYP